MKRKKMSLSMTFGRVSLLLVEQKKTVLAPLESPKQSRMQEISSECKRLREESHAGEGIEFGSLVF